VLFAWLRRFHVHPPADLADAVASTATDVNAHRAFARLYRGYACYAEISLEKLG
jgi:S-adenosylmethionine-diacylgycerolhomoserine-N-methlytransferase